MGHGMRQLMTDRGVHLGSSWVDGMRRHPGIPITGPAQPLRRRPRIGPSPLAAGRCAGNGAGGVPFCRARAEVAFAAMTHGTAGRTLILNRKRIQASP
jgi:hypothetical protein